MAFTSGGDLFNERIGPDRCEVVKPYPCTPQLVPADSAKLRGACGRYGSTTSVLIPIAKFASHLVSPAERDHEHYGQPPLFLPSNRFPTDRNTSRALAITRPHPATADHADAPSMAIRPPHPAAVKQLRPLATLGGKHGRYRRSEPDRQRRHAYCPIAAFPGCTKAPATSPATARRADPAESVDQSAADVLAKSLSKPPQGGHRTDATMGGRHLWIRP